MATEKRTYVCTAAVYRRDWGAWWAPMSGGKVAAGITGSALFYEARLTIDFAAIRNTNKTHSIKSAKILCYRTDEYTGTRHTDFWTSKTAEPDLSGNLGTLASTSAGLKTLTISASVYDYLTEAGVTYLHVNGDEYIEFYVNGGTTPLYLEIEWEPRDTTAKTTIYTGVASLAGGPTVTHAAKFRAVRSGLALTLFVEITSTLSGAADVISAGKYLRGYVSLPGYPAAVQDAANSYAYLKETNESWKGSIGLSRTCCFKINIPSIFGVSSIQITTGTQRSDSSLAGVHSRTSTITIPETVAPSVPGLSCDKTLDVAESLLTLTAVNNGLGDGTLAGYKFYFKHTGDWVLFYEGTLTTAQIRPSAFGAVPGSRFLFKVHIVSSTTQETPSAEIGFDCAQMPGIITPSVVANQVIYRNPFTVSWVLPDPGDGVLEEIQLRYYRGGVGHTFFLDPDVTSLELDPTTDFGDPIVAGETLAIKVVAHNTYDLYPSDTASPSVYVTFVGEPGKLWHKVLGTYKEGKSYVKVDGEWKEATGSFIKLDGVWREGI